MADNRDPPACAASTCKGPVGRDKDASPPKRLKFSEVNPYAIISLFDGVGSDIPAITKAVGGPPRIIIAAECDPILRQVVGEQFLFRTDGKWTQSSPDTFTIYADDVRQLLKDRCRIFREAFSLAGPQCRWFYWKLCDVAQSFLLSIVFWDAGVLVETDILENEHEV